MGGHLTKHGRPLSTMADHVTMVDHGCMTMDYHGEPWSTMVDHGIPWSSDRHFNLGHAEPVNQLS